MDVTGLWQSVVGPGRGGVPAFFTAPDNGEPFGGYVLNARRKDESDTGRFLRLSILGCETMTIFSKKRLYIFFLSKCVES